jgi:Tol biopolymer transport system component
VLHNVYLPRWSPDGRWLAVRHGSRGLALVDVGTGVVIPIPQVGHLVENCAWSPDSRKLAFVARSSPSGEFPSAGWLSVPDTSVHVVARDLNYEFECTELAWSADSRRFVALMYREHEHGDVPGSADLWLFGLKPGVCRLTATPGIEESSVGWLDERRVIFRWDDDESQGGFGTVLELPASPR